MAVKKEENLQPEFAAVEELQKRFSTPKAVYDGTKAMMGWRAGKQLTEAEYIKAVERFSTAAAGRRTNA